MRIFEGFHGLDESGHRCCQCEQMLCELRHCRHFFLCRQVLKTYRRKINRVPRPTDRGRSNFSWGEGSPCSRISLSVKSHFKKRGKTVHYSFIQGSSITRARIQQNENEDRLMRSKNTEIGETPSQPRNTAPTSANRDHPLPPKSYAPGSSAARARGS